jgi:hypothetical protein
VGEWDLWGRVLGLYRFQMLQACQLPTSHVMRGLLVG